MPYTNLIFFVLALLIYFTYLPYDEGSLPRGLVSLVAVFAGYAFFTWAAYRSSRKRLKARSLPLATALAMIGSLEYKLMVLALFLYFYLIYGAGLKEILWRADVAEWSSLFDLVAGITPFVLLLVILWANAYSLVRATQERAASRRAFILAQAKLNGPILLPVLLFSAFLDIFSLLWPGEGEPAELITSFEPFVFIPFLLVLALLYPVLLRRMWGCYALPQGDQRKTMEASCRKAGLKVAEIYLWPSLYGKPLTAGIAGMVGRLRYLFITPGLLSLLSDEELEAVIAHEAGHIRKGHVYYYMLIFLLLPLSLFLFHRLVVLGLYGFDDLIRIPQAADSLDPTLVSVALLAVLGGAVLFYLRVFFGLLSRNFEREADLSVFEVVGHAIPLISSLEKISYFGGHAKDAHNWHHYGIGERIRFLEECEKDKGKAAAHRRKVAAVKIFCVLAFVAAAALASAFTIPSAREAIEARLLGKKTDRMLERNLDDPAMMMSLAAGLQGAKRYQQAIAVYDRVIASYPNNEMALNNLAWL
jgi:Zn-dependent protease with chaperone function